MSEPLGSPAVRDWYRRRADAVLKRYTAFQCMHEHGSGEQLVDEDTPVQVFCPFHGNVNTPAARYYPALGHRSDYVHCYRCHESWDALSLYRKFKGLNFAEALKDLERRLGVKVESRPDDAPSVDEPVDRRGNYESTAWADVPRVLDMLEGQLSKLRRRGVPMIDYVRFCRVLDNVRYDLDLNKGQQTSAMVDILGRLRASMNDVPRMP